MRGSVQGWEQAVLALLDDLEQQAEGLALVERDARVAELMWAGYAEVDLLSRLHGGLGAALRLDVAGVGTLTGRLERVGSDWLLLVAGDREWLVRLAAVDAVRGLPDRAVGEVARPLTARLGIGSVLRSAAAERSRVVLHRTNGSAAPVVVRRVGVDFVEVETERSSSDHRAEVELVAMRAVAAVLRG